jgi:hypothetical protein
MEGFLGFLGIAVIFGIGFLISKGSRAAGKSLNRSVFQKGAYQAQQKMTHTVWGLETVASIEQIKKELKGYVSAQTEVPKLRAALYIAEDSGNRIVYRFGNSVVTNFTAVLGFFPKDSGLQAGLSIPQWLEMDGVSNANIPYGLKMVQPYFLLKCQS